MIVKEPRETDHCFVWPRANLEGANLTGAGPGCSHQALDRAVDRLYRVKGFTSERERVEHLFMLYKKMRAPLEAVMKAKPKRRRARGKSRGAVR